MQAAAHRSRFRLWPRVFLVFAALAGCEAEADPDPAQQVGDDMDVVDEDAAEGAAVDLGVMIDGSPPGEARWIAIIDNTEGLAIGGTFGTDVDAVGFECPDGRRGFAAGLAEEDADATAALGPPDGPCDPLNECSVSIGASGTLLARLDSGDLVGCTITVHEHADGVEDRFDLWTCTGPSFDACVGPWFGGRDGEAAAGEVGG